MRRSSGRAATGFRDVDLPAAALVLAQGAGRLIRSRADRGVVAVLDRRLATAGYRATLLESMPALRRVVDPAVVHEFLGATDATALGRRVDPEGRRDRRRERRWPGYPDAMARTFRERAVDVRTASASGSSAGSTATSVATRSSVTTRSSTPTDFAWIAALEAGTADRSARSSTRCSSTRTSSRTSRTSRPTSTRSPTTTGGRRSSSTGTASPPGNNVDRCPETARLLAADPGHDDGDVLDLRPAQAHPAARGPVQGRAAVPPRRCMVPEPRGRSAGSGSATTSGTGTRARASSSTTRSSTRRGTTPTGHGSCSSSTSSGRSPASPRICQRGRAEGDRLLAVHPGRQGAPQRVGEALRAGAEPRRLTLGPRLRPRGAARGRASTFASASAASSSSSAVVVDHQAEPDQADRPW